MSRHLAIFEGKKYVSLTTFRSSGQAVSTPVWFAMSDGRLYVQTLSWSGKVERIRKRGHVTVAPCEVDGVVTGPAVDAVARVLAGDDPDAEAGKAAIDHKYSATGRQSGLDASANGSQMVILEITLNGS